jgi:hypothetical protein
MPDVPPDPRAVINARIHHFKKQTQKLNLEFLEAEAELERAKEAVRRSRQAKPAAVAIPVPQVVAAAPAPAAAPQESEPASDTAPVQLVVTVKPFAGGVGYALAAQGADLWFDTEVHAINYAQDLYPHCPIQVLNRDGSVRHQYGASAPEGA